MRVGGWPSGGNSTVPLRQRNNEIFAVLWWRTTQSSLEQGCVGSRRGFPRHLHDQSAARQIISFASDHFCHWNVRGAGCSVPIKELARLNKNRAPADAMSEMPNQLTAAPAHAEELLGDLGPLAQQLGAPEEFHAAGGLVTLPGFPRVESAGSLRDFLAVYNAEMLSRVELPAILRAHQHVSRGEARELIALDAELGSEPMLRPFAAASRQIGRNQLRRFRPLRDQRLVQRYLQAMENGQASGWHTLVYGMMLAVYSLPLRQGLSAYAQQTLTGFAYSAVRGINLSEADLASLVENACVEIPTTINGLLSAKSLDQPSEFSRVAEL